MRRSTIARSPSSRPGLPVAPVLIGLVAVFAVARAWSTDAPTLQERASSIERVAAEPDGYRVVVGHISRKLGIPVDTLRVQRNGSGLGWGELLIANRVARETGVGFDQIVGEFRGGKGWEEIARDHHADLDALRRDVQLSQETVEHRADDKGVHTDATNPSDHSRSRGRDATGRRQRY